jgi:hypothetical protein
VDAAAECNSITINANSAGSANGITISDSYTLTVTDAISITAPSSFKTSLIAVNAGTLNAGSIAIHGGSLATSSLTVSTGTINCSGDISFTGGPSGVNLTFTGAGTLTIGGNLGSGGTLTASTGTVNFSGSGTQTIASYTFNNLTISGTGNISAIGNLTVNGTLSVSSGSVLNLTSSYVLSGTLSTITNDGTIKTSYTTGYYSPIPTGKTWGGTVEYASASGSQTIVAGTYNNLQLDNTSGTNTAGGILTVNGTLTVPANGTLSMSSYKLQGTLTTINNSGTITTSVYNDATPIPSGKTWGGTINYDRFMGGQTIVAGTYNNLTMNTGTNTAGGDITVNGTLTCNTFNLSTYKLDGNLSTVTFSGTIKTYCTQNPPLPAGINWSANNGTVEFAASTGGQYIPAGTYYNLQLDNTSNANTATGNLIVNYSVTTQAGGTLDMATYTLGGSLSNTFMANNGTIKTYNTSSTPIPSGKTWSGTIEYATQTGGQTIVSGTYYNLKLDNTSGTNTAGSNLTVSNAWTTTTGGTLDMGTYTLSINLYAYHNGILKTSNTSSTPFPSGKNWTTGGYTGTFEFAILSGGQTIPTGTYYNLQLDNTSGTNTAGGNLTVNGTLTTTAGGTLSMGSFGSYKLLGTLSTINNNGTIVTYSYADATPIPTGKTWGGTINYAYTGSKQTVVAGTYNNLTISGGGTSTAGGNITVNGTFTNGTSENFETANYIINCKGDVSNSGLCYDLGCGTGKILLNGTTNQNINGGQFERLELDNTAGVTLTNSITIKGSGTGCNSRLIMTNGNLNLNGNHITLETTYGAISNETNDRRIYDATDDGYITFTKTLLANTTYDNIAGMGIKIITDGTAPGSTVIKRGHKVQTLPINSSIKRYFDITPTTDQGLNATLRLSYFDNELNGSQEAAFNLYRSTNTGSTWSTETPTSIDYINNYVEKTAVNSLSRWTIGSYCTNTLAINPPTATICNGATASLTASGADTYTWSNTETESSITINPTTTSTYSVIGINSSGCTSIAQVVVTVNTLPNITASGATICEGTIANITASGGNTYIWNNSATGSSITVNPTATITYSVTGTDGNGCTNIAQAVVTVNSLPTITVNNAIIYIGSCATLTASGASIYTWNYGLGTDNPITVCPTVNTTYCVTGTDANGCTATASTIVILLNPNFVDGKIYFKIKELKSSVSIDDPDFQILNQKYSITSFGQAFTEYRAVSSELDKIYKMQIANIGLIDNAIADLKNLFYIEYAEKCPMVKLFQDDPEYVNGHQWYLNTINATNAWNDISGNNNHAVIAIIDNEFFTTHEDLQGVFLQGWDFADNDNNVNPPLNHQTQHGTGCAGMVGALTNNSIGIASISHNNVGNPRLQILPIKVQRDDSLLLNRSSMMDATWVYNGLAYAVLNTTHPKVDVISMSWGFYADNSVNVNGNFYTLQQLINEAYNRNIVCVAAAGNEGCQYSQFCPTIGGTLHVYPAECEHVITVGSTDSLDHRTVFTNFGNAIDVMAPGGYAIRTTASNPNNTSSYTYVAGTSCSCPLVAGICGLMRVLKPNYDVNSIETCLKNGCINIDAQNPGFNGALGAGRVDAHNALTCINNAVPSAKIIWQSSQTTCAYTPQKVLLDIHGATPYQVTLSNGQILNTSARPFYADVIPDLTNSTISIQSVTDGSGANATILGNGANFNVVNCCGTLLGNGNFNDYPGRCGHGEFVADQHCYTNNKDGHGTYMINYISLTKGNALYEDGPFGVPVDTAFCWPQNELRLPWRLWEQNNINITPNNQYFIGFFTRGGASNCITFTGDMHLRVRMTDAGGRRDSMNFIPQGEPIHSGCTGNTQGSSDSLYQSSFVWNCPLNFVGPITFSLLQVDNFNGYAYDYYIDDIELRPINNYVVTLNPPSSTICPGDSVVLTANGANTYIWSNGLGTGNQKIVKPLATTTYYVTGTNAGGCTNIVSAVVTVILNVTDTITNETCHSCNGSIIQTVALTCGTPPFSYLWDISVGEFGYLTTKDANNLCHGVYTCTITDSIGGQFVQHYTVGYNNMPGMDKTVSYTGQNAADTNLWPTVNPFGQNIGVEGNLTINRNITFTNCTFNMAAGTSIHVNAGYTLTLNSCVVQASPVCRLMWDGIYVTNSTAKIEMVNCIVSDANYSVRIEYGGNYNITSSDFNNNYISLYIGNMPDGSGSTGYLDINKRFSGNTITAGALLPGGYGNFSYYGAYINTYHGTYLGNDLIQIILYDDVFNGNFVNSVYMSDADVKIDNITITNNGGTGAKISKIPQKIDIINSHISGTGYGIYFTSFFENLTSYQKLLNIDNNTISNFDNTAIYFNAAYNYPYTVNVTNNNIDQSPKNGGTGIQVMAVYSAGKANINYNRIIGASVNKGISIDNFAAPYSSIEANTIEIYSSSQAPAVGRYGGIIAHNCANIIIRFNAVHGPDLWKYWINGIEVEYSAGARVTCNNVNDVGFGLWFGGNCPGTQALCNTMDNYLVGFNLNWNPGMGQQGSQTPDAPSDNQWEGYMPPLPDGAHTRATESDGSQTPLFVRNNNGLNPPLVPTVNTYKGIGIPIAINDFHSNTPIGEGVCWYALMTGKNPSNNSVSGNTRGIRDSENDSIEKRDSIEKIIAYNKFKYTVNPEENKWLNMAYLYSKLDKNKNSLNNDAQYQKVYDSLSTTSVDNIHGFYKELSDTTASNKQQVINNLLMLNNSIVPTTLVDETYKKVNSIYLETFAVNNIKLTPQQISDLTEVAMQCPYKYGNAVSEARAMLKLLDSSSVFMNECEKPVVMNNERSRGNGKNEKGNGESSSIYENNISKPFNVYPNPANDKLFVEYNLNEKQTGSFELYDIIGNKVASYKINSNLNSMQISINSLQGGIYTYKIIVDNNVVKVDKLVIIK